MKPNPKSNPSGPARKPARYTWIIWSPVTVLAVFAALAMAGTAWLAQNFKLLPPQKLGSSITDSLQSYLLRGSWRADAHTLVSVVEYILQPERPYTNWPPAPVAGPRMAARTNAETAAIFSTTPFLRT